MAQSYETLRIERSDDGHVGWLWLNRPEKLNAMTVRMWHELAALGVDLAADRQLRALVVIGEGRSFSAGLDLGAFSEAASQPMDTPEYGGTMQSMLETANAAFTWLEEAPFATIAAMRGHALGGGLQLALACDLRVAVPTTKMGLLEFRYGIIPDIGGLQRLPRLVGLGKAKELVLTCATIDAAEGHRIGLIERLVEDDALVGVVGELASTIAAQPPIAVREAKRLINHSLDMSVQDGIRALPAAQAHCSGSKDHAEALAAFVERRPPVYRNE